MANPRYFDYVKVATEAGINSEQLQQIERMFRRDYPTDDMLFELHVLRACNSVKAGRADLAAILRDTKPGDSAAA